MAGQAAQMREVKRKRRVTRAWCPVESSERVAERTYWLELTAPEIAAAAVPGQFVMIGFGTRHQGLPFLPRPNSIASGRDGRIGLFIRAFGAGSRRLAELKPRESALVLGPLGRGFELGTARKILCVAGGVGLAPFLLLPGSAEAEIRLLYGERQSDAVFDPAKIQDISGIEPEIWTEDGGLGQAGRVIDGVDLDGVELVLACGPTPMLKAVRRLAIEAGVPCQLAVEEHMACGMGTCIGCVIETVEPETGEEGHSLVCTDGPVFPAERLRWPI